MELALLLPVLFCCGLLRAADAGGGASSAAGAGVPGLAEQAFSRENSLMAFVRVRNLAEADGRIETLLQSIHKGAKARQLLKNAFGRAVFNPQMKTVKPDAWAEAVLFSLPLEPDNDWVYALRTSGEDPYITALLDSGGIRREAREEGITRFRQTDGDHYTMFYAAFAGADLALIGRNRTAVGKARKLYAFAFEKGLFDGYAADLALALHTSRYLLGESRVPGRIAEEVRQNLVRDLAGPQAKQENPLNLGLGKALESLTEISREAAIVSLTADFAEAAVTLEGGLISRYGGSMHYALSNLANHPLAAEGAPERILPPEAVALARGALWPELYMQVLDGFGKAMQASFARETPADVRAEAERLETLLKEAAPQEYAAGLLDPSAGVRGAGPALVSVIRWKNPQKAAEFWDAGVRTLTDGQLAELLAERGMKLAIEFSSARLNASGWPVHRVSVTGNSTYFALPGGLGKTQRYLATLAGEYLVLVLPAGPVSAEEYQYAEPTLLEALSRTLARLPAGVKAPGNGASSPGVTASPAVAAGPVWKLPERQAGEMLCCSANPLRLVQAAVHAESVWPDPAQPNRLPVPWTQYYNEFMRFPAKSEEMTLRMNVTGERLSVVLRLPVRTLAELAAAGLDFSAPVVKE